MTGPGRPHHMQTSQPPLTASARRGNTTVSSIADADDSGTVDKSIWACEP
jgi:hypothetical protein